MAVLASTVLVAGGASADGHSDRTALAATARGNVVDTEASSQSPMQTLLEQVHDVVVYEEGGKRFALTGSANEGPHIVDITDVNSIKPMPQPTQNAPLLQSDAVAAGVDTWIANDGNRYFAMAWSNSDALQIMRTHSTGRLWAAWANGSQKYIIDGNRLDGASDVFVYTLQTGTCQTSSGCEVFPGVSVNQGDPIYKNYAVVSAVGNQTASLTARTGSAIHIYDVTNPNALCNCSSGAGQTALLEGSVVSSSSVKLFGAGGVTYYQQGNKHYALVSATSEDSIQIVDITDPENPVARDSLSDTTALELDAVQESAVYSVNGRLYAVAVGESDDGIQIVDVTDPTDITAVSKVEDSSELLLDGPRGVTMHTIDGLHYAVVASEVEDGLQVIDVTDPSTPVAKAKLAHGSGRLLDGAFAVDTFTVGNKHYAIVAAADSNALQIVELTAVTADAGPDTDIPKTATQVTLDGTGSTVSSGATPTYQWTQTSGATVSLSGATTARPTFVPPAAGGVLTFRLTVTAAGVSSSDTVTITVETSAKNVDSHGARIGGAAVNTEQVQKPDGGAATYISMHFSGENETQVITYSLLEEPTGTATVNVMTLVQSAGYGAPGYTWDWDAVSVSPKTLTFTTSNWSDPQTITITSNPDADLTPEQVLIVFQTYALGQYTGIHITVDDRTQSGVGGQGSPGTDGELGGLKRPGDTGPETAPNSPPTVANPIADIGPLVVGGDETVDLSGVFADTDGDTLTFAVDSTDDFVSTALVRYTPSPEMWVLAMGEGTAELTVTADDGNGGTVTDTFTVAVTATAPNRAPTVASAIDDATIANRSGTHQVSLSGVFDDADGDALTITAVSSKTRVATVSVSADQASLTVSARERGPCRFSNCPWQEGPATITVTAGDGNGGVVSDTFTVTVKEAPTVANPIADIASLDAGTAKLISLSDVFADADGDALTLSAASSDTAVATVSAQVDPFTGSATAITVTAASSGTATVTVTARDSDSNTVTDTFDVTVPAAQQQSQQYQGGNSDGSGDESPQGDSDDGALPDEFDPPTDEHALEEPVVLIPGAVHNLTLTATGNGGVRVSWDAPTIGSAPTRYIVHLRPEGGKAGSGKTKRPKASKTQVKFNKLEPGTTYQVWVRAQNALGKGERTHATITLPTP